MGARFQRAYQDTKGFRAWKMELLVAFVAGVLCWLLLPGQEAVSQITAITIAVIAAILIVPLIEYFWNYYRAPVRILTDENISLREKIEKYESSLTLVSKVSPDRLERLYGEGQRLVDYRKGDGPAAEWRNNIREWFDRSEDAVNVDTPKEAFMYHTSCDKPGPKEIYDDCPILLKKRLNQLRLIISRMQ